MEAKDLMIGNWLHHNGSWSYRQTNTKEFKEFDFQWCESDWYALGECTLFLDNIEPIPLTEEWLLKFIENFDNTSVVINSFRGKYYIFTIDGALYYYFTDTGTIERHSSKIYKYIHQIQNLYFVLTGTELEIK
jgi:hypothetical protein